MVWVICNGRIEDRIRDYSSPMRAMNAMVKYIIRIKSGQKIASNP